MKSDPVELFARLFKKLGREGVERILNGTDRAVSASALKDAYERGLKEGFEKGRRDGFADGAAHQARLNAKKGEESVETPAIRMLKRVTGWAP